MNNQLIPNPPDPGYPAYEPMDELPPARPRFQWSKFLTSLRRFWWVPALTLTLAVTAAVVHFFVMPPIFYSTGRMWETEKLQLPGGAAFTENAQNNLGTQSDLLRSERLRQLALARLQSDGLTIPKDSDGEPLEADIRVLQSAKSSVFAVEVTSAHPGFTPVFLDALMNEYIEYKRNVRKIVSGGTLASISEQVLRLERDLKADQDALNDFQRTNNLGVLEEEGLVAGNYLARLKTQLADYQLEMKLLEATALEQRSATPALTTNAAAIAVSLRSPGGTGNTPADAQGLTTAREIELLQLERERLGKFLRPKHPKIVKLDNDIQRAQQLMEIYRRQNLEQVATAREALKIRIASVESSIDEWEARVAAAKVRIASGERLRQNVSRNQALYDRLVSLLQNVDISRNIDQATLAILEPATPVKRSYKEAKSNLTLSIFGGLATGLGIIFLIAIRDDRFTSLQEVNDQMGGAVVGQVPEMPVARDGAPLELLADQDDRHIYAESYRNLRSALLFLAVEGTRPQVLLITSALPNEGKSTITANLARALAMGGARVLLIDGDLRKGHLHELLGLEAKPGLAELLQSPVDPRPFIQTNSLANFSFIPRGSLRSNPGDLFLNSTFEQLLAGLRQQFDYILIDSCPVFAADDATTLAPRVDGTLFVVRSRFSRARAVREALSQLSQRQARILGLVFNRADSGARSYNYYKHADYYHVAAKAD
jgi:capsular exopolysaccharide synthesis family protein